MTLITNGNQWTDFLGKRDQLIGLLQRQRHVLQLLQMTSWDGKVEQLIQRAQNDTFKVLVIGEFKRGKSTFINALLGKDILPAYATPTTAIVNEVKWGERPKAILHYRADKSSSKCDSREIPIDQITEYITIRNEQQGYGDQSVVYENPYEKVELFWPLALCQNGVEIVDSPGLNEDPERQKITLGYLATVDAVIFVIACDFPISVSERDRINDIKAADHETVFFICNRLNMIRKPEDQQRVRERCQSILAPLTKQGNKHIFFIDALSALEGRLMHDEERVRRSNLLVVEEELHTFLAHERGHVKFMRPAAGLKVAIREVRTALPKERKLLNMSLETLEVNYVRAQQGLNELENERRMMVDGMRHSRADLRSMVLSEAIHFYGDIMDKVDSWLSSYNIQKPMGLTEVFSGKARERVVVEVVKYLTNSISESFKDWQSLILKPLIDKQIQFIEKDLQNRIQTFGKMLGEIRNTIAENNQVVITDTAANQENIFEKGHALGIASGVTVDMLLDNPSLTIMGSVLDFKEMQKFTVTVKATITLSPAFLLPAMLSAGAILSLKANAINKQIRSAVGQEYKRMLIENRLAIADEIAESIDEKVAYIQRELDQALGIQLQSEREQVEAIIAKKHQGQAQVEQMLRELILANNEIDSIDHELNNLIEQIVLP